MAGEQRDDFSLVTLPCYDSSGVGVSPRLSLQCENSGLCFSLTEDVN